MGWREEIGFNENLFLTSSVVMDIPDFAIAPIEIKGLVSNKVLDDERNHMPGYPDTEREVQADLLTLQRRQLQAIINCLGQIMNGDETKDSWQVY